VRPILEYGAACWDPYRECQIKALDCVPREAAKYANHTNVSVCETLTQRSRIAHICALLKLCSGERAWKAIMESYNDLVT